MIDVQNMSIHSFRIVLKHLFLGRTTLKTRVPFPFASKSLFIAASDKILLIKFSFGTTFFPSFGEGEKKKEKEKNFPWIYLRSERLDDYYVREKCHIVSIWGDETLSLSLPSAREVRSSSDTRLRQRHVARSGVSSLATPRRGVQDRRVSRRGSCVATTGENRRARGRPCASSASVNGRRRRYTASIWIFACTWSRRGQLPALQYVHNWGEHAPPLYISPPLVSLFYLRSLLCLSIRELLSTCLVSLLAPSSLILFLFSFLEQEEGEFSGGIYFLSVRINRFSSLFL